MKQYLSVLICFLALLRSAYSQDPMKPVVSAPVYFDISAPLRNYRTDPMQKHPPVGQAGAVNNVFGKQGEWKTNQGMHSDPVVQNYFGRNRPDSTLQNFEGIANSDNLFSKAPPDPCGDAGPNHYVQIVNACYAVYSKTGDSLLGPISSGLIWSGLPYSTASGDGVVRYDEQADRWLISQLCLVNDVDGPFYQLIAVSQTPDPTGSWYRWEYQFAELPDYPKFGIWTDGYYMTCNRYSATSMNYRGAGAIAFDRSAMLAGDPGARSILFTISGSNINSTLLPADCDGVFPPQGTPEYLAYVYPTFLGIYDFSVNWQNPSASVLGNFRMLPVGDFSTSGFGVPQKGTSQRLDDLDDRLMYRLQYRRFSDHASMVVNHTVVLNTHYGIRWYELRKSTADWSIFQQSTYAPDSLSRWAGSIAMDTSENIALGFSVSSTTMYPSVRYTGRMKHDPPAQMTLAEQTIMSGSGSQTGSWSGRSRWGDYSMMSVDPVNPQRFWYTQEYYATTSQMGWRTRVGSFSFTGIISIVASVSTPTVCAGGTIQLDVDVYGATGACTYLWSSIPPGFTSNLKNPVASPVADTKYVISVSIGAQTRQDTVKVFGIPNISVYAGRDTTWCRSMNRIPVQGSGTNYITTRWESDGDGIFTDPFAIQTFYSPGSRDRMAGSANLKLTAYPQPPCHSVSSSQHIDFVNCK